MHACHGARRHGAHGSDGLNEAPLGRHVLLSVAQLKLGTGEILQGTKRNLTVKAIIVIIAYAAGWILLYIFEQSNL